MSRPTCAHCNTAATDLRRCSHCKKASYCNKDCQKAHWKKHKPICFGNIRVRPGQIIATDCLIDPSKQHEFPTFSEYLEECDRNGQPHVIPNEIHTLQRDPDGLIVAMIDEDKHQEYQRRKAEEKAASAAKESKKKCGDRF